MQYDKRLQKLTKNELIKRIDLALTRAVSTAQIDGDHHRLWTIDQMVRCLTGCPENECGQCVESSDEYEKFVEEYCFDENGDEYSWETGSPP